MFVDRIKLYQKLAELRNSKILTYITGDRPGLETQIGPDAIDCFIDHLDLIGVQPKISLFLYTRGGNTLAAWSIINLIRQFCDELEVIIPFKAHSAGTLMSLGANKIIMTKQATLGPIDPSLNNPLNPQIPGAPPHAKAPVSVEAIKGFLELATKELKITNGHALSNILIKLSEKVHPLVLGQAYRSKEQIKMLANKLLCKQITDKRKIQKIISFLCSESGSHDYTINRREARDHLGLAVEKPDEKLYIIIKQIFDDIKNELQLNVGYDPNVLLGQNSQFMYNLNRCLIESVEGGCHAFVSEGLLTRKQIQIPPNPVPQISIEDRRLFEGWRKIQ